MPWCAQTEQGADWPAHVKAASNLPELVSRLQLCCRRPGLWASVCSLAVRASTCLCGAFKVHSATLCGHPAHGDKDEMGREKAGIISSVAGLCRRNMRPACGTLQACVSGIIPAQHIQPPGAGGKAEGAAAAAMDDAFVRSPLSGRRYHLRCLPQQDRELVRHGCTTSCTYDTWSSQWCECPVRHSRHALLGPTAFWTIAREL